VLGAAALRISNGSPDLDGLYRHLDAINLLDEERLRPGWDLYFMVSPALPSAMFPPRLASYATSVRS
jgi:dCMP deaminase